MKIFAFLKSENRIIGTDIVSGISLRSTAYTINCLLYSIFQHVPPIALPLGCALITNSVSSSPNYPNPPLTSFI